MMKKNFNLLRYKELLKLKQNGEISFLDLELLTYEASPGHQMGYNRKKDYFLLIQKYLSGIISLDEFRSKFFQLEEEDSEKGSKILKDFQKLEVLTLAKDLEIFSDLMGKISTLCLEYYELGDGTLKRMSESEFYSLVNNNYLQLQEAFPFENLK